MRHTRTRRLAGLVGAALVATLLTNVPSQAVGDPVVAGELVPAIDGPGLAVTGHSPLESTSATYLIHTYGTNVVGLPLQEKIVRISDGALVRAIPRLSGESRYYAKIVDSSWTQVVEINGGRTFQVHDVVSGNLTWSIAQTGSYVHGDDEYLLETVVGSTPGMVKLRLTRPGSAPVLSSTEFDGNPTWVAGDSAAAYLTLDDKTWSVDPTTGAATELNLGSSLLQVTSDRILASRSAAVASGVSGAVDLVVLNRATRATLETTRILQNTHGLRYFLLGHDLFVLDSSPGIGKGTVRQVNPGTGAFGAVLASDVLALRTDSAGGAVLVTTDADPGRLVQATSAPPTFRTILTLPVLPRAVEGLGISGDTIAVSWSGLPGVWTRPWAGSTWTKTYGDNLFPIDSQATFEFRGGVLGTKYGDYLVPKVYTFPGGQRTVPLGTEHTQLTRGGVYTVRGPGNNNRWYVENTRTGVVVGGPYSSYPVVDGARAWTHTAGQDSVVADDLTDGPTHTLAIPKPCSVGGASLDDVRGRWFLFGCDGGSVVVDVTGQRAKLPVPGLRGFAGLGYGYMLWDAVIDDPESPGNQIVVLKARSLSTGETRTYGALYTSDMRLSWDGDSTSRAVYRDRSYQLRKIDLSWATANPEVGARQVTGVRSSFGDRSARVTWTGTPANLAPVSSYRVTVQPGGRSVVLGGSARSAEITGLRNGLGYRFTVTAIDAYGSGQPSALSSAVVPAGKPGTVTPRTKRTGKKVTVTWRAPAGNGRSVLRYLVKIDATTRVVSAATHRTVFKGVRAGKHRISVRAVTAAGTGTARSIAVRVPR